MVKSTLIVQLIEKHVQIKILVVHVRMAFMEKIVQIIVHHRVPIVSSFNNCTAYENGLNPILGKCQTCMEKYEGCSEEFDNSRCKKCLKFFEPSFNSSTGECNT